MIISASNPMLIPINHLLIFPFSLFSGVTVGATLGLIWATPWLGVTVSLVPKVGVGMTVSLAPAVDTIVGINCKLIFGSTFLKIIGVAVGITLIRAGTQAITFWENTKVNRTNKVAVANVFFITSIISPFSNNSQKWGIIGCDFN